MEIRKDTWHYKAWQRSYRGTDESAPAQVSLCDYVWRVACEKTMAAMFVFVVYFVATVIGIIGNTLTIALGIGIVRPYRYLNDYEDGAGFSAFPPVRIAGRAVHAYCVMPFVVGVPTVAALYRAYPGQVMVITSIILATVACVGLYVGLRAAWRRAAATDTGRLVGAYVQARKQGVCPRITFVQPR